MEWSCPSVHEIRECTGISLACHLVDLALLFGIIIHDLLPVLSKYLLPSSSDPPTLF